MRCHEMLQAATSHLGYSLFEDVPFIGYKALIVFLAYQISISVVFTHVMCV